MNRTGPLEHTECKCGTDCVWLRSAVMDNGRPRPAWVMVEAESVSGNDDEDFQKDRRGFPIAPEGVVIHDPQQCEKAEAGQS